MSPSTAPVPGSSDASHVSEVVDKVAETVKPHLRGWIHAVAVVNPLTRVLEAGRSFLAGTPTEAATAFGAAAGLALLFSWWALRGLRKRLERDSIETQAMTSEEFTQFVAGEIAKWTPVAKRVMQAN